MERITSITEPITLERGEWLIRDITVDASGWDIEPGRANWMIKAGARCHLYMDRVRFINMTGDYIRGVLASRHNVPDGEAVASVHCLECEWLNFIAVPRAGQSNPWRFDCDAFAQLGSWEDFRANFFGCQFYGIDGRFIKSQTPGVLVRGGQGHGGPRLKTAISLQEGGGTVGGFYTTGVSYRDAVFQANGDGDATFVNNTVFSADDKTDVFESKDGTGLISVGWNEVNGDYKRMYKISGNQDRLIHLDDGVI
jgi:hypothetical protein